MSIKVTLRTPGTLDFTTFLQSTNELLTLLAPLAKFRHSNSKIAHDISSEVAQFVRAIRQGVKAAQCGFTTADDLVALVTSPQNSSTLEERTTYLMGTLKLADEAYTESQQAYQAFSDVRKRIYRLSSEYNSKLSSRASGQSADTSEMQRAMKEFREGVHILEKFATQTSALTSWWDWIKVETNVAPKGSQRSVIFDDSSLREPGVLDRWRVLRTQFLEYTNTAAILEDRYPELFSLTEEPASSNQKRTQAKLHRADIQTALTWTDPAQVIPKPQDKKAKKTAAIDGEGFHKKLCWCF